MWPVRGVRIILLRQLEETMAERGVVVDHSAVHRWALELLPVRRVVFIAAEQGLLGYTGSVRHCLRCRLQGDAVLVEIVNWAFMTRSFLRASEIRLVGRDFSTTLASCTLI